MKTKLLICSFIFLFTMSCTDDNNDTIENNNGSSENTDLEETIDLTEDVEEEEYKDLICFLDSFDYSDLKQMIFDVNSIIDPIIETIPESIKSEFEIKYKIWEKTYPLYEVHGAPIMYARSEEYYSLLDYCKSYGKALWPLALKKIIRDVICTSFDDEEMLAISGWDGEPSRYFGLISFNLLMDLEPEYNWHFLHRINSLIGYNYYGGNGHGRIVYTYFIAVVEKDNILQAIQDLREAENVAEE